jgi:secreted trypsin-like serine protease
MRISRFVMSFTALIALSLCAHAQDSTTTTKKAKTQTSDTDMIVGGKDADANEWPWQVRLFENKKDTDGFCGGSLIARQWVLTAAHCLVDTKRVVIGYGNNKLNGLKRVASAKVIVHKGYDPDTMENDIALVKLSKPVKFGDGTTSVDVAGGDFYKKLVGTKAWVTGWGFLFDLEEFQEKYPDADIPWNKLTPKKLQEVDVTVQDLAVCQANYGESKIPEGQLCAGYKRGGKDSCQGDSGGPLVAADPKNDRGWVQVGVVSWGRGCARAKYFGIYTRADYYRGWVQTTIDKN